MIKIIKGKGMPVYKEEGKYGDLFVKFNICWKRLYFFIVVYVHYIVVKHINSIYIYSDVKEISFIFLFIVNCLLIN
jgi:hypothetical protein